MPDVTILAQPLDETWQALGADVGVWPENVQLTSDQWGPAQCTFDLKRASDTPWPRLAAFTPVDVHVDGLHVFGGRVKETPVRDGADSTMSVVCEGWQFHLDDDMYARLYVHNELTAWVNTRTLPGAALNQYTNVGKVETGGQLKLGWATGDQVTTLDHVGVTLDLGAGSGGARRVLFYVERMNGGTSETVVIRGHNDGQPGAGEYEDAYINGTMSSIASPSTIGGTFTRQWRYVTLLVYYEGPGGTHTADAHLVVKNALVFRATAYESGNESVLTADDVVSDALDRATQLLSTDRSGIEATTFAIPALHFQDHRTPRQAIDTANAWHNYVTAIDPIGRMLFRAQPSYPELEVGAWSGADFQDASASSGEDIYDRVLVTGQSPAGTPYVVDRYAGMVDALAQIRTTTATSVSVTNPSFATDTTGWAVSSKVTGWGITIARNTGTFDSSPAALQIAYAGASPPSWSSPGPGQVTGDLTGTFERGITYRLTGRVLNNTSDRFYVWFGNTLGDYYDGGDVSPKARLEIGGSWQTFTAYWTPRDTVNASTDANVKILASSANINAAYSVYLDSMVLHELQAGTVQRRGFHRTMNLQVSTPLPDDGIAAAQLGDTWLAAHATVPFRGTVTLTGGALRGVTTGETVPLARLLTMPRALLRFSDRGDPDTGAHGRDGRIASVTYDPQQDQASVAIDNTRANFDALLARLAVVSGD